MIRSWTLVLCYFLLACDSPSFKGSSTSTTTPYSANSDGTIQESKAAEEESSHKECLLATGADTKSIVSISQGNVDLSKIVPNSVLLLEVQGQAQIDLSAAQLSSLRGICIYAGGGANIQLDLNASVLSMFYRSRGNSTTKLNFGIAGSLAKLITDVSGGSRLQLAGEKLDCASLKFPYGGSSTITCNGSAL